MFDVNVYLRIHTSRGFDRNCDSKNHGWYVAGCKIDMQACYKKTMLKTAHPQRKVKI